MPEGGRNGPYARPVAVRSRLLHAALAGDLDPRLGPVAAIAFLYGVSFSTFWVYLGVFAVDGMRWRPDAVGALFLVSAPAAAAALERAAGGTARPVDVRAAADQRAAGSRHAGKRAADAAGTAAAAAGPSDAPNRTGRASANATDQRNGAEPRYAAHGLHTR